MEYHRGVKQKITRFDFYQTTLDAKQRSELLALLWRGNKAEKGATI